MFWKTLITAGTVGSGLLAWHHSGIGLAFIVAAAVCSTLLSIKDYYYYNHGILYGTIAAAVASASLLGIPWAALITLLAFLGQVAFYDHFIQRNHAIRHNFPVLGWCRYGLEMIGDELRQYWFMNNREERPYNRITRRYIYQSAKGLNNNLGFGTQEPYRDVGQIHLLNGMFPVPESEPGPKTIPQIVIGKKRRQPYVCPWPINISGMSWGALSREAVEALSSGARLANIHMLTGEGGLTPYHLNGVTRRVAFKERALHQWQSVLSHCTWGWSKAPKPLIATTMGGGRIIAQLGAAKFGYRKWYKEPFTTADGRGYRKRWTNELDWDKVAEVAANPQIVGFEIKLAQGAKPGQGGKLPKEKITPELAEWRGIEMGIDCYSPNAWDEFHDVPSLFAFIKKMQEVTGKPVGIKIVVGRLDEVRAIAKMMQETGEGPDMITIDGGEGGTGAAPVALADMMGQPILHALPSVDTILREHSVRDEVVLIASGQIAKGNDVALHLAMGADMVNIGRGFLLAEGCIMALRCHTNKCPVGITTQDPKLRSGFDPADKYVKVANYAMVLQRELLMILRSCGVHTPWELTRFHVGLVKETMKEASMADQYPYPDGSQGKRNPTLVAAAAVDPDRFDPLGPKLIQIAPYNKHH